jgi:hypothetical protein
MGSEANLDEVNIFEIEDFRFKISSTGNLKSEI